MATHEWSETKQIIALLSIICIKIGLTPDEVKIGVEKCKEAMEEAMEQVEKEAQP